MEKFTIGLMIGGICGAMLVANNYKMRTLVKKGQDEVKQKLDEMMDEKIKEMGGDTSEPSNQSQQSNQIQQTNQTEQRGTQKFDENENQGKSSSQTTGKMKKSK